MIRSEAINELTIALAKAQGAFAAVAKSRSNPFLKTRYATLDDIISATRKPLSDNGLAVVQTIAQGEGGMDMETTLLHASGQWIASVMRVLPDKPTDPQRVGSALTYARRYALAAILGVAPEDDDDGQLAAKPAPRNVRPDTGEVVEPESKPGFVAEAMKMGATEANDPEAEGDGPAPGGITEPQRKKIYACAKERDKTPEQMKTLMKDRYGVESTSELTRHQASDLIEFFVGKAK